MKLMIGLDMGKNCGFAVKEYGRNYEKLISLNTYNFWDCVSMVATILDSEQNKAKYESMMVVIEDVTQNRAIFDVVNLYNKTVGNHESKLRVVASVGQRVGAVKEDTELMINFCEDNEYVVHLVVPHRGGTTKYKAEMFNRITGWQGDSNEHNRDAAMMIWGLNKQ